MTHSIAVEMRRAGSRPSTSRRSLLAIPISTQGRLLARYVLLDVESTEMSRVPLLEDGVKDLDVHQHGLGDHGSVGPQRLRASERRHHDAAEAVMGPGVMRDFHAEQIVVGPPLQRVVVEIEDLLGGERDQARRELRPQPPPCLVVLLPRWQFLHHDIGMSEQEWIGQIIPDRDAAEEDEMQIVRERARTGLGERKARIGPGPEDLTLEAFDRDRVRLKRAGVFASGDAGEADRLRANRALRRHVLEFAGMSGAGEQRSGDGEVKREPAQAIPAGHSAAGINYIVKKRHVPPYQPSSVTTMAGRMRLGVLEFVRSCERIALRYPIEDTLNSAP